MDRITQNRRVLGYMRQHKSITPLTALSRLGVMRLGARIWELKRAGHSIDSTLIASGNRHYSRYTLISKA